ncbi:MAG: hypothetical protein J2P26_14650, partial [Nocardiopsaceae bacterium]|nr:hypothetical protein [Nocardiopsaceae bacterium]
DLSLGWGAADGEWNKTVAGSVAHVAAGPYLDELRASCPDPFHATAYQSMVLEASVCRALLKHAGRLDDGADDLHYHARRQERIDEPHSLPTAGHAQHMRAVASAMRSQVSWFNPDTELPVQGGPFPGAADERARQEEVVLAAALGGRLRGRAALRSLTEEAFTGPVRRTMFNIMAALDATDGYIDRLTVDWELTRNLPDPSRPKGDRAGGGSPQSYVTRLAAMDPASAAVERASAALARRSAPAPDDRNPAAEGPGPNPVQPPPGLAEPAQGQTPRR